MKIIINYAIDIQLNITKVNICVESIIPKQTILIMN